MSMAEPIIQELKFEAQAARKVLERVPVEKFPWKPHEKSMTFGRLASHVAETLSWGTTTLTQDSFEFKSGEFKPFEASDTEEMLKMFDDNVDKVVRALENTTDEQLLQPWRMIVDGNEVINMPRIAVLRTWVLNHLIHHRGQLTVYLRENDIPVPSIYGPSADEQG